MTKRSHRVLSGSSSDFFSDWDALFRSLPPEKQRMQIKLILNTEHNLDELEIPRHFSLRRRRALFARAVGVKEEHLKRFRRFARRYKLEIINENTDIGIITLSGTVAAVNKAFNVKLYHHHVRDETTRDTRKVLGHEGDASIPVEIHDLISGVIGLNNKPADHQVPASVRHPVTVCAAKGVSSSWFAEYYKFPKTFKGKGQHIAIISCGGGYDPKDFLIYFRKAGIRNPPKIKFISLDGMGNPGGTSMSADYELYTDCLVAGCAAPEATITVCAVENSIYGFAAGITYLSTLKRNRPHAISYSWGSSETEYSASDIEGVNRKLQYAAQVSQISVFCSTGDFGSTNSSDNKPAKLAVQFPASSPWITACGGTMFELTSTGKVRKEVAWKAIYLYDMLIQNASGGGFSVMNSRPSYQNNIIQRKNYPRKYRSGRGVPDIAAHANVTPDNLCYWVYIQGQNWMTGGTSAVAPLMAALTVRLNEALGLRIGFINPYLYEMAGSRAIKPVTEGNNSMPNGPDAWEAGPSWDPCTGLGVPNGEAMLRWLKKRLQS